MANQKFFMLLFAVLLLVMVVIYSLRTEKELPGGSVIQPIIAIPIFLALLGAALAFLKSIYDRVGEVAEAEAELLLIELLQQSPGIKLPEICKKIKKKSIIFYIFPNSVTLALRYLVRSGRVISRDGKYFLANIP